MKCPLAVTILGTCPSPGRYCADPLARSLWDYLSGFTLLAREIDSCSENLELISLSKKISQLQVGLPEAFRFRAGWLDQPTSRSSCPLDIHAAYLHQRTHDFLISLNQRRIGHGTSSKGLSNLVITGKTHTDENHVQMLQSCREVLYVFQYFRRSASRGIACWTTCQQAYRAATLLIWPSGPGTQHDDFGLAYQTYKALSETSRRGPHTLGQVLAAKLGRFLKASQQVLQSQCFTNMPLTLQNGQYLDPSSLGDQSGVYNDEQLIWPEFERSQLGRPSQATKNLRQPAQSRSRSRLLNERSQSFEPKASGSVNSSLDRQSQQLPATVHEVFCDSPTQGSLSQGGAPAVSYTGLNLLPVTSQPSTGAPIPPVVPTVKSEAAAYEASLDPYAYQEIEATSKAWSDLDQASPTVPVPISTTYLDTSVQHFAMELDGPHSSPNGGHSNMSSSYTHSNASSLHTPLESHPVTPVGSYEHASKTYCLNSTTQRPSGATTIFEAGPVEDDSGVLAMDAQQALTLEEMQSCARQIHWPSESMGCTQA